MADARAHRQTRNLSERVSRADKERRRSFRSLRRLERYVLRGVYSPCGRRLCALVRSLWTVRAAGSHDYSDRAETGLLLLMAVCPAVAAPSFARNTGTAHWSRARNPRIA